MCLQGEVHLHLCRSIIEELLRVLDYPKFRFPKTHKTAFIQDLLRIADLAEPETVPDVVAADPADNHLLACVVAAEADFLLTGDKHLLALNAYGSTVICTAAAFWEFWSGNG